VESIRDGERLRGMNGAREGHGIPRNGGWRDECSPHPLSFMTCFTDSCSLGPLPVQTTDIRPRTQLALAWRLCFATSWLCVFSLSVKCGKGSLCISPLKFPVIFQEYCGLDPGLSCDHFLGLE